MKNKVSAILVLSILLLSIMASSFGALAETANNQNKYTTPNFKSFSLDLDGNGHTGDSHHHQQTDVSISLVASGSADGKLRRIVNLDVKSGDLNIQGITTDIAVNRGHGLIINSCKYIQLSLTLTEKYGGHTTHCFLTGKVTSISDNTLTVKLSSCSIVLPTQGHPTITDISLKGTITLKY